MSCGGRIYKGDTVYVSVPFDVEGYSALTISFFTNGEYKITRTEEEVTIEDGFITAVFEGHDLDVLPDGVLRYTIECEVEGEEYVDSSNTMFYLKTPKDYDAADVQDFYNSGWTEGFASGLTEGFPTGYASGHTDGQTEGYASGYTEGYDSGYTTGRSKGWQDGVDWEYNRISQSAITLSFSGNGEWHKDFFSEVFCNGVSVNVIGKGEDMSKYNIAYCFQVDDPTQENNFRLFGDSAAEEHLYTYFAEAYCPELGVKQVFDEQHRAMNLSFTTSGNHIVWLSQKKELPYNDEFMRIFTTSPVIQIVTSDQYRLANIFKEGDYTEDITTIIDIAQNTPTSAPLVGQGNWYYPSSRAVAPSVEGWTAIPVGDDVIEVLRNLYKF